jgi:aryl carrier-like protein
MFAPADVLLKYNVAVEMERNADSIVWRNACKSSAFDLIGTHHMLDLLDSLLSHIVQNSDHPTFAYKQGHLVIGNTMAVRRQKQTLNGVRIDLADISTAIKQLSRNIDDCAAVVTTEDGHDVLVVFVTGHQAEDAIPELLDRAKKTLPQWSIPSHIASCKAIPYKDSEVDIQALQTMLVALPNELHQLSKPREDWSSLEQQIRRILSQVSGQPEAEIHRDQTIFHLGLDSISAIKLSSDLRKEEIMLTVADILREATVERMANAAHSKDGNPIAKSAVDIEAVLKKALAGLDISTCLAGFSETQVEAVYPATAGQLYMIEAWNSSQRTLFMPTFTFKTSQTDLARIQSAWETLLSQEPLLRTAFRQTGDAVIPYIQVVLQRSLPQFSWYQSSQPTDNSFLRFLKNQEQKKPVDLFLPPVRLCANITPYGSTLFLTIHHALYDGTSLPLLLSRLGELLNGPTSSPSRSPSLRFSGYLAFTHSQDLRKQKSFWQDYLHNARPTLVSTRASPWQQSSSRSKAYRPRAQAHTDLLESKCRTAGISLQAVFLAAFAKLYLTRLPVSATVTDEVVFGIYLSNRNLPVPDLPNMPGPTLNIVPLRVRGVSTTNLVNLAKKVQEDLIAISNPENAVVDLHRIARWTGVEVDCFFNFLKSPSGGEDVAGHGLEEIEVDTTGDVVQINNDEESVGRRYRSLFSQLFSRVFGLGALVRIVRFWQWILRIVDRRKVKAAQLASTKTAIEFASSGVTIQVCHFCRLTTKRHC